MSEEVAGAPLRAVAENGPTPEYETLPGRYEAAARSLVRSYAADAAFNGLAYDRDDELEQVEEYAASVGPPGEDDRLPAWNDAPIAPTEVREAATADLEAIR